MREGEGRGGVVVDPDQGLAFRGVCRNLFELELSEFFGMWTTGNRLTDNRTTGHADDWSCGLLLTALVMHLTRPTAN